MAVTTWTAGQVLTAADLNDTLASKLPYSYGTATPSTTDSGFLWYDSNSTPAAPKFWDGAAFQALTSGKILQIVRATDSTDRTTTSTSFVDASISVSITPQKSDSAIVLWYLGTSRMSGNFASDLRMRLQITDNSNNAISGAEDVYRGSNNGSSTGTMTFDNPASIVAYATPATTSAVIYKLRFCVTSSTGTLKNTDSTGQMYALEVSA